MLLHTASYRNDVKQMWILKKSKNLIYNLHSCYINNVLYYIRSDDFSTLYTTLSHNKLKLKPRDEDIILGNTSSWQQFSVTYKIDYFTKYNEETIIRMLNFLIFGLVGYT